MPDSTSPFDERREYPDGCVVHLDGRVEYPDGRVRHPDGRVVHPDGVVVYLDGRVTYPDGRVRHPDGRMEHPDGRVRYSSGRVTYPNGRVVHLVDPELPDGRVEDPGGVVRHPDGRVEYPGGVVDYPDGRVEYPDGRMEYPDGRMEYPDGRVTYPDGRVEYPNGRVEGFYDDDDNDNDNDNDDDDDDDDDDRTQRSYLLPHDARVPMRYYRYDRNVMISDVRPKPRTLYLGVEIEMEPGSMAMQRESEEICTAAFPCFAKGDGSLSEYGIEIVSQPITPDAWRHLESVMNDTFTLLRRKGVRAYNTQTCGLHVHLSRAGFQGAAHLFKFTSLLYHNPKFAYRLSQRANYQAMSRWAGFGDASIEHLPEKVKQAGHDTGDYTRYAGVNLLNPTTVELRFFRGTLGLEGFYRALEFAESLVEFTRAATLEEAYYLPAFRKFIVTRAKRYPRLSAWFANQMPATPTTSD